MSKLNLESITPILERNDVKFAGVFGSAARGEAEGDSDIDILISFRKPRSLLKIIELERNLSDALGERVDLVTEKSLSPYIRENVMRDLKPIYGER